VLPSADWILVIFDGTLLIVMLFPVLYLFMFRLYGWVYMSTLAYRENIM